MKRVLAVLLVLTAACSSTSGKPAASPTTTASKGSSVSMVTTTPTTAPGAVSATAPPPGPTMTFPTHKAASDHLFNAWKSGDRAGALQGASADVVNQLFAIPPAGWVRYYYGGYCDTGEFDSGTCNFRSDNMYARVISTHTAAGWTVTSIFISHD